jgi:hypothetical protein
MHKKAQAACTEFSVGNPCRPLRTHWLTPATGVGTGTVNEYEASLDSRGRVLLAWTDGPTGEFPNLAIGEELDAPANANGGTISVHLASASLTSAFNMSPAIAAGKDGEATVLWQHQTRIEASIVSSTRSSSGQWQHPIRIEERISLPGVWTGSPRIVCNQTSRCLAIWTQAGTPPDSKLSHAEQFFGLAVNEREALGKPWVGPRDRTDVVSPQIYFVDGNQVAMAEDGSALLAWYQAGSTPASRKHVLATYKSERAKPGVAFPRIDRNDTLSPTTHDVSGNRSGHAVWPMIGPGGRAAVVWSQESEVTSNGEVRSAMVALRRADGTWEKPVSIEDGLVEHGKDAFAIEGAFAEDGSMLVAWQEGNKAPRRSIRAVWLGPGERVAKPGSAVTISAPNADAIGPSLAYSPGRGFVLGWSEVGSDGVFRPHLRIRKSGPSANWSRPYRHQDVKANAINMRVLVDEPFSRIVLTWKSGDLGKEKLVAIALE